MIFGGMHENSMIDFPGKLACVLFVSGCNFHCPYCHNPALALNRMDSETAVEKEAVMQFLDERRSFLDGVVITGGEPTLQPMLLSVCREIKTLGYPIKIDTNGSRPAVIEALLRAGVVDYIAMDIKSDPAHYTPLIRKEDDPASILSSIRLILSSGVPHEFRSTCVSPFVDVSTVDTIARLIEGADLYALQRFRPAEVLDPAFCQKKDRHPDEPTLQRFRSAAQPWVKRCVIR